ncbi:hypothetical protein JN27_05765 [Massilia sp. BSC265]|nr:hypothetical protein JN27_05765 [Massilia sp. BSC265]
MGTDVSDVRDPDFVWLSHIELPLQMIRCYRRRTAAFETTLAIACLRAQAGCTHDSVNAIDPALLAQVAQVV